MRTTTSTLVLLLALLAGCTASPGASAPGAAASGGAPTADLASPPDGLPDALAFTAATIDGTGFDGGDFAGQDLMLWFWAPW
jgi:hypothetical protein